MRLSVYSVIGWCLRCYLSKHSWARNAYNPVLSVVVSVRIFRPNEMSGHEKGNNRGTFYLFVWARGPRLCTSGQCPPMLRWLRRRQVFAVNSGEVSSEGDRRGCVSLFMSGVSLSIPLHTPAGKHKSIPTMKPPAWLRRCKPERSGVEPTHVTAAKAPPAGLKDRPFRRDLLKVSALWNVSGDTFEGVKRIQLN